MANYAYVAVDARGGETRGNIEVSTPLEAVRRIKVATIQAAWFCLGSMANLWHSTIFYLRRKTK